MPASGKHGLKGSIHFLKSIDYTVRLWQVLHRTLWQAVRLLPPLSNGQHFHGFHVKGVLWRSNAQWWPWIQGLWLLYRCQILTFVIQGHQVAHLWLMASKRKKPGYTFPCSFLFSYRLGDELFKNAALDTEIEVKCWGRQRQSTLLSGSAYEKTKILVCLKCGLRGTLCDNPWHDTLINTGIKMEQLVKAIKKYQTLE